MSNSRKYKVSLTGASPLLLHADDVSSEERARTWSEKNKKKSKAGDDRSPAWKWIGYAYVNNGVFCIPSDNLMTMLREGGAQVVVPGGRSGKTFKAQSQSGLSVSEFAWPICLKGKPVSAAFLEDLREEEDDFAAHEAACVKAGFMLFVKRARVGQNKHIRVRPRFDAWTASGTVDVWDEQITTEVLCEILRVAGDTKGLCDWRPSSKTPGPHGRFTAEVKQIKS